MDEMSDRQANHSTDKPNEIQMTRQTNQLMNILTDGPTDRQANIELKIDRQPDKWINSQSV